MQLINTYHSYDVDVALLYRDKRYISPKLGKTKINCSGKITVNTHKWIWINEYIRVTR